VIKALVSCGPSEDSGEESFLGSYSSWWLPDPCPQFLTLQCITPTSASIFLGLPFPLSVCVSLGKGFPPLIKTPVRLGLGTTLIQYDLILITSAKSLFLNKISFRWT
jgi:hypothetical protein